MNFNHYIFDLDGTLIDTENAVLRTWQTTLREYGHSYTLEDLKVVLGVTTEKGLTRLNTCVDEMFPERWRMNYQLFAQTAVFFDGVPEMLERLKRNGCHLGAVSSRCREEYRKFFLFFQLEKWLSSIILEEDTKKHKPDPEPILKYLQVSGAKPDECIYIGDMPSDVECANRAGVSSGYVLWNNTETLCLEANFLIKSPDEL